MNPERRERILSALDDEEGSHIFISVSGDVNRTFHSGRVVEDRKHLVLMIDVLSERLKDLTEILVEEEGIETEVRIQKDYLDDPEASE